MPDLTTMSVRELRDLHACGWESGELADADMMDAIVKEIERRIKPLPENWYVMKMTMPPITAPEPTT